MGYYEEQREIQSKYFVGQCGGIFNGREYPFVLQDRRNNLYEDIVDDAIKYFNDNGIGWWQGKDNLPTNHILSSQVACVNHLFWLNKSLSAATKVLKQIDKEYIAIPFPDTKNYVEFELNGCDADHKNYLGNQEQQRSKHNFY